MSYSRYKYCVSGVYQGFQGTRGTYLSCDIFNDIDEAVEAMKILENLGEHRDITLYEMIKIDIPEIH